MIYDVPINDVIEALANELKSVKDISAPEWAVYVKTGMHKERPPVREDWWYIRAAAVLKSVDKLGPIGVSKLRTKYGGKKNRGHKPGKFYRGSGNILRKVLQQLEKAGLVKKQEKDVHKGRKITPAGKKLIKKAIEEARKSYSKKVKEAEIPAVTAETKPVKAESKHIEKKETVSAAAKPEAKAEKTEAPAKEASPKAKSEVKKEEPKAEQKPTEEKKQENPAEKPAEKVPTAHELAAKKNE